MAEMNRDGRNRNRGTAAATQQEGTAQGGCSGLARRAGTHGPVPAGACMQGGRQGRWERAAHGREQAAWGQHRTGAGGSASCCLGAQGEEREGPRAGGGLARCAKKNNRGGAYIGDGEFLTCAPSEESGLGWRGSGCEEKKKKKKRNVPDY